jgi:hypothetical protein
MATKKQIDELKRAWLDDPCWDIYETEGFEAHKDELMAFQEDQEKIWEQKRSARANEEMKKMGIEGKVQLYKEIKSLVYRIENLEQLLEKQIDSTNVRFYNLDQSIN